MSRFVARLRGNPELAIFLAIALGTSATSPIESTRRAGRKPARKR